MCIRNLERDCQWVGRLLLALGQKPALAQSDLGSGKEGLSLVSRYVLLMVFISLCNIKVRIQELPLAIRC